jgi:hypothetical protein
MTPASRPAHCGARIRVLAALLLGGVTALVPTGAGAQMRAPAALTQLAGAPTSPRAALAAVTSMPAASVSSTSDRVAGWALLSLMAPAAYGAGYALTGNCGDTTACRTRRMVWTMAGGITAGSAMALATTPNLSRADAMAVPLAQTVYHAVGYGLASWWLPQWLGATAGAAPRMSPAATVLGAAAFEILEGALVVSAHPLVLSGEAGRLRVGTTLPW